MLGEKSILFMAHALFIFLILVSACRGFEADGNGTCHVLETESSFVLTTRGRYDIHLWPSHRIVYQLGSNLRASDKETFYKALDGYHRHTCLRFEPRKNNEAGYIDVFMNLGDWDYCGMAHFCYQGNRQEVEIWHKCSNVKTFVHEIGHALCLHHEQERVDRDDYLDFSKCDSPSSILRIKDSLTTRGHLFDYNSQMHYYCSRCHGLPKMNMVSRCGKDVNEDGLSVLDADKLNTYYNCQGCHRHRWYRLDTLTHAQKSSLVNFDTSGTAPLYLCRGYINGEISTGMYSVSERACILSLEAVVYKVTQEIQLFGLPNGPSVVTNTTTGGYGLLNPLDESQAKYFIRAGRTVENIVLFAAVVEFIDESDGQKHTLIGKVKAPFLDFGRFPFGGEVKYVFSKDSPDFYILGCID